MSEHLTDRDAIKMAYDYYSIKFPAKDAAQVVNTMLKVDLIGLIRWVFEAGMKTKGGVND